MAARATRDRSSPPSRTRRPPPPTGPSWTPIVASTAIRHYFHLIDRWAMAACYGDRDAADDVVADVHVRLVRHLATVRDLRAVRSWLRTTTRNAARDRYRREAPYRKAAHFEHAFRAQMFADGDTCLSPDVHVRPELSLAPDIEQALQRSERHSLLLRLIQALPPLERRVVRARFGVGDDGQRDGPQTLIRLAAALGCSISTVHRIERRGLRRLRRALERRQQRLATDETTIA